ncbi:hypothetical protein DF185_03835 [Marinifilum breve]|uniref:Uncharacterized protein n=1 Tax=Marinifilum breve TaxID=2184082 RepID=A0A2V4AGI0_9BACT|nr:hypothetical protein [Marinifilum breve]PXY03224.1 hypothetical protein DF185_03835 [Marinifilum breve]
MRITKSLSLTFLMLFLCYLTYILTSILNSWTEEWKSYFAASCISIGILLSILTVVTIVRDKTYGNPKKLNAILMGVFVGILIVLLELIGFENEVLFALVPSIALIVKFLGIKISRLLVFLNLIDFE